MKSSARDGVKGRQRFLAHGIWQTGKQQFACLCLSSNDVQYNISYYHQARVVYVVKIKQSKDGKLLNNSGSKV